MMATGTGYMATVLAENQYSQDSLLLCMFDSNLVRCDDVQC